MTYIPAFDPFAASYRMLHILTHLQPHEVVEADRLCIFDFYLLFPTEAHHIRLRRSEADLRTLLRQYVPKKANPYCTVPHRRRLFGDMRPYQFAALRRLAATGLICPRQLLAGQVKVADMQRLRQVTDMLAPLPVGEANMIAWLYHSFRTTPMGGEYGLKYRTQLMEYKYDGQ